MAFATLSVLIPLYNEEEFVCELLARVLAAPLPPGIGLEIVIVDDCSKDLSVELVRNFIAGHPEVSFHLILHEKNAGKGAAIQTAIKAATGYYSVIQDSDLEYDPSEYPQLLAPLLSGKADIVFGSRFVVAGERRVLYYWHSLANHLLTWLCNIAADINLTDMETCYKAFRTSLARSIPLESKRFGLEPEMTIKFARRGARIYETPISYYGRTYEEGKKIGLKDAFEALWVIFNSRFTRHLFTDPGAQALSVLANAPKFNRWMADTVSPYIGQRVLEIGAGTGNMTKLLCPKRKRYVATDIQPEYIEKLGHTFQRRPVVSVGKLDCEKPEDFAPYAGQFDTVVCLNVLEHIADDAGTLRRLRTALEPGGRLVLLVPNDPAAYGAFDEALGHHRRYTREQLATMLAAAGFELEEMLKFNRISTPGWRINGQWLKSRSLPGLGLKVFDKMVWLWRKIDASLPWEPTSIIAIARVV